MRQFWLSALGTIGLAAYVALPHVVLGDDVCSATAESGTSASATVCTASAASACPLCPGAGAAPAPTPTPTPDSTLLTDLVSAWVLEDETDSHGANDLTNNNGVTFVAPGGTPPANMPGTVANFVAASSQSLSRAAMTAAASYSVAVWIRAPSLTGDRQIYGLGNLWPNNVQFHFRGSPSVTSFLVGSGGAFVQATSGLTAINDGAWHLLIGTFDSGSQVARVYIDNAEGDGSPSASLGAAHYSVASTLGIGSGVLGASTMQASHALLASRVWTPTEIACLYNAGAGAFYPFTGVCLP